MERLPWIHLFKKRPLGPGAHPGGTVPPSVPSLRCWSSPCPAGFSQPVWTRRVFAHLSEIPEGCGEDGGGCGEDGVGCQPGTGTVNSPLLLMHGSAARCITSSHIASAEKARFLLSIRIEFLTD